MSSVRYVSVIASKRRLSISSSSGNPCFFLSAFTVDLKLSIFSCSSSVYSISESSSKSLKSTSSSAKISTPSSFKKSSDKNLLDMFLILNKSPMSNSELPISALLFHTLSSKSNICFFSLLLYSGFTYLFLGKSSSSKESHISWSSSVNSTGASSTGDSSGACSKAGSCSTTVSVSFSFSRFSNISFISNLNFPNLFKKSTVSS